MYTGTLIDDLMAAVDRAEEHAQMAKQDALDSMLVSAIYEMVQSDQNLLGAA
jgi:hypothetical protein